MTHIWQGLRSGEWLTAGNGPACRSAALRRADIAVWTVIGFSAAVIAGFALWTSFEIAWRSFLAPISVTALLAIGAWFYRSIRGEQRLGAILASTSQIIGFAAVAAPLLNIAATAGFPLQDATFDAWDHYLHFDWVQMTTLISPRPGLQWILQLAYFQLRRANDHHGARAWHSRATRPAMHLHPRIRFHDTGHHRDISHLSRSGTVALSRSPTFDGERLPARLVDQLAGLPRTA